MKLQDLVGRRFGKWVVVCRNFPKGAKKTFWFCRCDCGNERVVAANALTTGSTKSCGCLQPEKADISGNKYGRWLVLRRDRRNPSTECYFFCRCECGTERSIKSAELKNGNSKSCGCIQRLPEGMCARNQLIRSYQRHAKRRKHQWKMTADEFERLTRSDCHYCGRAPAQEHKSGGSTYIYNGLDRVDSAGAYELNNVVPCCKACNFAKHVMSTEEFLEWVTAVYNHSVKKL